MKPITPAMTACLRASLPSVAETCESEISASFTGSAPDWSSCARFWAEVSVKPPEICEPLDASMPVGLAVKSMKGTVISCSSRTTAKCCWACSLVTPGSSAF